VAETLNNLHCVPFEFTATAAVEVVDSFSTRTVTCAARWYRHLLGDSGASGAAHTTPTEFFGYFESLLNAAPGGSYWSVSPTAAGPPQITYNGGTGAAAINWTSTVPRNVLGFTSNLTFAAPGASQTASYLPTHCLFAVAKGTEDSDWVPEFPGLAASVTVGGVVDVLSDGIALVTRRCQWINVPRRWTDRTAMGAAGTPMLPEDLSVTRLTNVGGAVAAGIAPPWTIHQHAYAARAKLCAFTDQLQDIFTGATALYDVGYVHPETLLSTQQMRAMAPGFRARVVRADWVMTLTNREERP
jgi:hypothetical protein